MSPKRGVYTDASYIILFQGGWKECYWSEKMQKCLSPSYAPLKCLGGVCGSLLSGSKDQCPTGCDSHQKAHSYITFSEMDYNSEKVAGGGLGRVEGCGGIYLVFTTISSFHRPLLLVKNFTSFFWFLQYRRKYINMFFKLGWFSSTKSTRALCT